MNVFFISRDFSGASLCARLAREGHFVRAYVESPAYRQTLDGVVEKIDHLEDGLDWVGRDGLIVCDDTGFGALQDRLRTEGYRVVGGSAGGDRLEDDRGHAQQVFAAHGLRAIPTHVFAGAAEAAAFVERHGGQWVVKRNGPADKTSCYVGRLDDGRDVRDLLRNSARQPGDRTTRYVLQQRIHGIEIGVGRYFNGRDWVGPIELNIEHKKLFPGDLGPKTAEMGTLVWYSGDEQQRLFREMLAPLAPHLRAVDFRGDVDINCIVNREGAWPLEATTRFGYPAVQAQMALHETPWGEFLAAVAEGREGELRWRSGYAVAVLVAVPPFPYCGQMCGCAADPRGLPIHFHAPPESEDWAHLHFEGAAESAAGAGAVQHVIVDSSGYVMHAVAHGTTVEAAREGAYRRAANIVIPRMYYRTDIAERFLRTDRAQLMQWGWL